MDKALKTTLTCIVALALNLLVVAIFHSGNSSFPLFLDTIFTVAVVFYCGLVPALCVSVAYNLINGFLWNFREQISDPVVYLYAVCGILIVIVTWLVARHKEEFHISPVVTILYLLIIAMFSSLCTIITGGIMDYFHFKYFNIPDVMSPIKKFTDSFVRQNFSLFTSCILAQIPVSFADRLITTFAGYGVYRIAERFLGEL